MIPALIVHQTKTPITRLELHVGHQKATEKPSLSHRR
ncbi:hypothetical protein VCSRO96_2555 [Vibrio cholerae]|nr:hypothetical protein VCSRO96_2555 [Vibrio cholerae]GHY83033.1 hypothetical protein VCSRO26_1990 [Vibrio cholerae]GIA47309.1 hypothetical protein VCSRO86_2818 [Vibrio cholerae]